MGLTEKVCHVAPEHPHLPTPGQGGRTRKRRSIITGQDCHAVADDPHAERARCKKLTWWGFAENAPKVLKTVRLNGLVPLQTARTAPGPPRPTPTSARVLDRPGSSEALASEPITDIGFEVLRAAARGSGSRMQGASQCSATTVEGGFVRAVKPLPGSCKIFRLRQGMSAGQPNRHYSSWLGRSVSHGEK
eukprot:s6604_g3.t3